MTVATASPGKAPSAVTAASNAFVAEHLATAVELGERLAELVHDPDAFLEAEAQTARRDDDGNRAWVIRDSLSKLPDHTAAHLRAGLEEIRRRPAAPSTSRAAMIAAQFASTGAARRPAHSTREE